MVTNKFCSLHEVWFDCYKKGQCALDYECFACKCISFNVGKHVEEVDVNFINIISVYYPTILMLTISHLFSSQNFFSNKSSYFGLFHYGNVRVCGTADITETLEFVTMVTLFSAFCKCKSWKNRIRMCLKYNYIILQTIKYGNFLTYSLSNTKMD